MGYNFYKEGEFHLLGLPAYPQNLKSDHHLSNKWTIVCSSITCSFNCIQVGEKSFSYSFAFPSFKLHLLVSGIEPIGFHFPRGKEDMFKCREKHSQTCSFKNPRVHYPESWRMLMGVFEGWFRLYRIFAWSTDFNISSILTCLGRDTIQKYNKHGFMPTCTASSFHVVAGVWYLIFYSKWQVLDI